MGFGVGLGVGFVVVFEVGLGVGFVVGLGFGVVVVVWVSVGFGDGLVLGCFVELLISNWLHPSQPHKQMLTFK